MINDSKLVYFDILPTEIIELIWEHVTPLIKSNINKANFDKYYNYRLINICQNENIEKYVRFIIVNDYIFILKNILKIKFDFWFKIKNYHYKYIIYPNLMHFLHNFSIQNNSQKCRQYIIKMFENRGISKNLHKKNRIRNIGWTN